MRNKKERKKVLWNRLINKTLRLSTNPDTAPSFIK